MATILSSLQKPFMRKWDYQNPLVGISSKCWYKRDIWFPNRKTAISLTFTKDQRNKPKRLPFFENDSRAKQTALVLRKRKSLEKYIIDKIDKNRYMRAMFLPKGNKWVISIQTSYLFSKNSKREAHRYFATKPQQRHSCKSSECDKMKRRIK